MQNNIEKQKEYVANQKKKRRKFVIKVGIPYLLLSLFLFLFGYDTPLFDQHKLAEFFPAFIILFLLILFISIIKYKVYPLCTKCGAEIRKVKKDCVLGDIEFLGTFDKVKYENVETTIKGKTTFPRGGYSMRNSVMEHTSESTYEVNQKIPVVKKYYLYSVSYRCKYCNTLFCKYKKESDKPLYTKK